MLIVERVFDRPVAFPLAGLGAVHRAVCRAVLGALNWLKMLCNRLLNNVLLFVSVIDCGYLCYANDPYYGITGDGHRAYDHASPVHDAAGSFISAGRVD